MVITVRPASGASVASALPPYLMALSTRLEIARRMAVGRQNIVTSRGPEKVAFSPASMASSQMPSIRAVRSTSEHRTKREAGMAVLLGRPEPAVSDLAPTSN